MNGVGKVQLRVQLVSFITFLNNETTTCQQETCTTFLTNEIANSTENTKSTMIRANELTDLLDRMMKTDIFHPSEKLQMIRDEEKTFLDPNLIMDARHRILREDLSVSPTKCSVLAEAKRYDALSRSKGEGVFLKKNSQFADY